jgi:hypothetical protein
MVLKMYKLFIALAILALGIGAMVYYIADDASKQKTGIQRQIEEDERLSNQ